ncbi:MAG: FtsX-like permease family protein [Ilumatobacteraceae bacterium]
MAVAWLIARIELRRNWRGLLGLALLVTFVAAAVMTATVGADRASTSIDRFRVWAGASDATYQGDNYSASEKMLAAAAELPDVEGVAEGHLINAFLIDNPVSDIAVFSDPAGRFAREVDRPIVLEGRMPADDAPNEIMLNELSATLTGLGVGEHVQAKTWSQDDLEALFSAGVPGFGGPQLDLVVVGIGRFLDELPGDVARTSPYAVGSPAFLDAHPGIGVWPGFVSVRVDNGVEGFQRVSDVLSPLQRSDIIDDFDGSSVPAFTAQAQYIDTARRAVDTLAIGLLVFALAAAIAGGFVVGQAVLRSLARASATATTLDQLGLPLSRTATALAIPTAVAGSIGAVAGMVVAIAASPLLPVGLARRAEIDPGVRIAPQIVMPLALLAMVAIASFAFLASLRAGVADVDDRRRRPSGLSATARRWGIRPTIATGIQLATDRGEPSRPVPVRAAFVALTIGVAGVAGSAVVATSWHSLNDQPGRWGWNWSTMPDLFEERSAEELQTLQDRLNADPRLAAVGELSSTGVFINGVAMNGTSLTAFAGDLSLTRRDGRLPSGASEIALGTQTMSDLAVTIGDPVDVRTPEGGTRRFTVVGTAVFPKEEGVSIDVGAAFTPDGLASVGAEQALTSAILVYPEGVDVAALETGLTRDYGFTFTSFSRPQPPAAVTNLSVAADIARALGWFFAALGALGLLHTLVISSARRSAHLAILRTLGFERSQVRLAVLVQATVLGVVSLLVGLPAGWIGGRVVWRIVASGTGALAPPATPWFLLVALVPIGLMVTWIVSWWPANSAAHQDPTRHLGTE